VKSSIEWLISEFEKQIEFRPNSELDIWFKELFPKAKQMHREETECFGAVCCLKTTQKNQWSLEGLYNETFEQDARKQN